MCVYGTIGTQLWEMLVLVISCFWGTTESGKRHSRLACRYRNFFDRCREKRPVSRAVSEFVTRLSFHLISFRCPVMGWQWTWIGTSGALLWDALLLKVPSYGKCLSWWFLASRSQLSRARGTVGWLAGTNSLVDLA